MTGTYDRRRVLRATAAAGALSVGVPLAGCSGAPAATVGMTDRLAFEPRSVTVPVGATVVWENAGRIGHSVTAYRDGIPADADYFASGGFGSEAAARDAYPEGEIALEESYEHTFDVAGTYRYFCIPHESSGMEGTVEVTEG